MRAPAPHPRPWFGRAAEVARGGRAVPRHADAYAPLVWQCRYSGVEVPDALWWYAESGAGVPYADNQAEDLTRERAVMKAFDAWTDAFAAHVGARRQVTPGRWRAFGYEPPRKGFQDLKLTWREMRMRLGVPLEGSSPDVQQRLGTEPRRDAASGPQREHTELRLAHAGSTPPSSRNAAPGRGPR